jgi:hypothetical protein
MAYLPHRLATITPLLLLTCIVIFGAFLRFYHLTDLPRGLNWDETAYAYNAYSLLQTGRDEWGNAWPLFLKSFGEYKPALLSYLMIPGMALFPHSDATPRAVIATLSILSIVATFALVRQLSGNTHLALLSALTLAISPWHIHFSRTALDPSIAHPLLLLGMWAWSTQKKTAWVVGSILLSLSMYAYSAERLFVPLILVCYAGVFWRHSLKKHIRGRAIALSILLLAASFLWAETLWGVSSIRALSVSFMKSSEVQAYVRDAQLRAATLHQPWLTLAHHPYVITASLVARQYSFYWRPDFLFFSGGGVNASPILGFPKRGNLPEILLPFLLIGLVVAASSRNKIHWFFLFWALLAPLPGALTTDGPHAGRALLMLPALNYLIAVGLWWCSEKITTRISPKISLLVIWLVLGIWTLSWMSEYLAYFPEQSESSWQGQFKDMSQWVGAQNQYSHVAMTRQNDMHALLFYAWYNRINPENIQQATHEGSSPYFISGYSEVQLLPNNLTQTACALLQPNTLVILAEKESREFVTAPLKTFYYYHRYRQPQEVVFQVYDSEGWEMSDVTKLQTECNGL